MANEITLDCLGESSPIPLDKTITAMEKLDIGDILIVLVNHSSAIKNIPDWAREQGHYVDIEQMADGEWECVIEKVK